MARSASTLHGKGPTPGALAATVAVAVVLVTSIAFEAATLGQRVRTGPGLAAVLGADVDTDGFARAVGRRAFSFPSDHGAHPAYRSEWWYFTGNLETARDRHFGYQLTLFRFALTPPGVAPAGASPLRPDAIYMGHLAMTDTRAGTFFSEERFARGAGALAGTTAAADVVGTFEGFLDDWRIDFDKGRWTLAAGAGGHSIALSLRPSKPVVLQGEDGLSQKSAAAGNASWYYSVPRLTTGGRIVTPEGTFEVEGTSWLDREWSTSALSREQVGWDWFALQLSDGSDVMFYRLRTRDGGADPVSAGRLIGADGDAEALTLSDVRLRAGRRWRSDATGARYPVEWSFAIERTDTSLTVTPRLDAQEHASAFPYWEGAVVVSGRHRGRPVTGVGYVELTGY